MKQDLLSFANWTPEDTKALLDLAVTIKQNPAKYSQVLAGKSVAALFEKPSLRPPIPLLCCSPQLLLEATTATGCRAPGPS